MKVAPEFKSEWTHCTGTVHWLCSPIFFGLIRPSEEATIEANKSVRPSSKPVFFQFFPVNIYLSIWSFSSLNISGPEYLKSIQVKSSGENQSLPIVESKAGMSSTSSHDLVSSDTDIYIECGAASCYLQISLTECGAAPCYLQNL